LAERRSALGERAVEADGIRRSLLERSARPEGELARDLGLETLLAERAGERFAELGLLEGRVEQALEPLRGTARPLHGGAPEQAHRELATQRVRKWFCIVRGAELNPERDALVDVRSQICALLELEEPSGERSRVRSARRVERGAVLVGRVRLRFQRRRGSVAHRVSRPGSCDCSLPQAVPAGRTDGTSALFSIVSSLRRSIATAFTARTRKDAKRRSLRDGLTTHRFDARDSPSRNIYRMD